MLLAHETCNEVQRRACMCLPDALTLVWGDATSRFWNHKLPLLEGGSTAARSPLLWLGWTARVMAGSGVPWPPGMAAADLTAAGNACGCRSQRGPVAAQRGLPLAGARGSAGVSAVVHVQAGVHAARVGNGACRVRDRQPPPHSQPPAYSQPPCLMHAGEQLVELTIRVAGLSPFCEVGIGYVHDVPPVSVSGPVHKLQASRGSWCGLPTCMH